MAFFPAPTFTVAAIAFESASGPDSSAFSVAAQAETPPEIRAIEAAASRSAHKRSSATRAWPPLTPALFAATTAR